MSKPTFDEFMKRVIPVTFRSGDPVIDTCHYPDALMRMQNIIRDGGCNLGGQVSKILALFRNGDDFLLLNVNSETKGAMLPVFLVDSRSMHHCRSIYRQAF